jgi:hypothetical protein
VAHQHDGARVDCPSAQVCVEQIAPQCDGVVREVAVAWPGRSRLTSAVDETYPGETVPAERDRVDVEQCQFTDRSRGDRITARLVPRDRPLLDDRDVVARSRQPRGDRRPGRTAADDEDVGVQGAYRQPADAGEPTTASGPTGMISAPPISGASGEV